MTTSDEQFLVERRMADERRFLISSMDPDVAPRNYRVMHAIKAAVSAAPAPYTAVLAAGVRASDVTVKTVDNLIRRLVHHGFLVRSGVYVRATRHAVAEDTRSLKLGDWPERGQ